jgi:hypothetical protein
MIVDLTAKELALLVAALDSHAYWQVSEALRTRVRDVRSFASGLLQRE